MLIQLSQPWSTEAHFPSRLRRGRAKKKKNKYKNPKKKKRNKAKPHNPEIFHSIYRVVKWKCPLSLYM